MDKCLHTFVLTLAQPHKKSWNVFLLKKNKLNKTEWLLQQNHRVGGVTEGPNGRMDTAHQGCC